MKTPLSAPPISSLNNPLLNSHPPNSTTILVSQSIPNSDSLPIPISNSTSESAVDKLSVARSLQAGIGSKPELALPCTVSFYGNPLPSISGLAVIDTAAGFSYISLSDSLRKKIPVQEIPPFRVGLADDSTAIIRHRASVNLSILCTDGNPAISDLLEVFVFSSSNPDHECFLLLGRSSLRQFQIHTGPGLVYLKDGAVLLNHNRVHESVRSVTAPNSPDVNRIVDWLCKKSWEPLVRASSDYGFRLRPLLSSEIKDTPEQTHAFEIRIPRPSQSTRSLDPLILTNYIHDVESAARGHLARQTSKNQAKAAELIQEYVDLSFWVPSSEAECRQASAHLPTPVFLIGGDGDSSQRKPRLVCNFKPANKLLPPAGNSDRVPSHLLAALRLSGPRVILVTDASRAFYKLRLCDPEGAGADKLWLVAASPRGGVQHFLCSRLAFGLSVGPSALVSTMGRLVSYPQMCKSFLGWYIDDLILASTNAVSVFNDFSLIESLLKRVGHFPQREKTYLISHPSTRSETVNLFGSELPLQETAKVFGAHLSFQADSLVVQCDNSDKMKALSILSSLNLDTSTLTKRDFFKFGGQLGYDLPRQHAEGCLLADCLRSVVGRIKEAWHTPLQLSSIQPESLQLALKILREWALELSKISEICSHSTPLVFSHSVPIEVFCDASSSGGAFIISRGGCPVWEEAFRWTHTKTRWHSNRLECFTLWAAIRCLADILQCLGNCSNGNPDRPNVFIYCDNRSSVSWARDGNTNVGGKQQRRAMFRLIDSLGDEIRTVKQFADIKVVHLPGDCNVAADKLSRLCAQIQPLLEGDGLPSPNATTNLSEILSQSSVEPEPISFLSSDLAVVTDIELDIPASELDCFSDSIYFCSVRPTELCLPIDIMYASSGTLLDFIVNHPDVVPKDFVHRTYPLSCDSWVEKISGDSYDIGTICFQAAILRFVLQAWARPSHREAIPYPIFFSEEDRLSVARSLQAGIDSNQTRFLHFDPNTSVWYTREPLISGEFRYVPFIPASAVAFQTKVISDAHRASAHRGPDYTLSFVKDWSLERPMKRTIAFVSTCVHCQIKRAKRGFHSDLEMSTDRSILAPFQSISLDHLCIGSKTYCLSAMCRLTGFVFLAFAASHSVEDTWSSLRSILYRMPRRPTCFLTDKATHIFQNVLEKYQKFYGLAIEYRHTPSYSPHENGQLERVHASVLSILKTSLHLSHLEEIEDSTPHEIQSLLDSVSYVLNLRPLCRAHLDLSHRSVISPMYLVYGPGILDNVFDSKLPAPPRSCHKNYLSWRKFYDGFYWRRLKSESSKAFSRKATKLSFAVGELVLYYAPSSSKAKLDYKAGRIQDIRGNQLLIQSDSKTFTISIHNACKLLLRDDSSSPFDVNRIGARIQLTMKEVSYPGTVVDEAGGELLVRWDLLDIDSVQTGWPDEWVDPSSITFLYD